MLHFIRPALSKEENLKATDTDVPSLSCRCQPWLSIGNSRDCQKISSAWGPLRPMHSGPLAVGVHPSVCLRDCPANLTHNWARNCCVCGGEHEERMKMSEKSWTVGSAPACRSASSEAGESPVFGPVLDFHLPKHEVKKQAEHVDGSRQEEDIPPSRHRILGQKVELSVSAAPSPWVLATLRLLLASADLRERRGRRVTATCLRLSEKAPK